MLNLTELIEQNKDYFKATEWNEIFDLSILGMQERLAQLEEKGGTDHGK